MDPQVGFWSVFFPKQGSLANANILETPGAK